jgi:hypothetical protein
MNSNFTASRLALVTSLFSCCISSGIAAPSDCPSAAEYINAKFGEAERTIASHYEKRFYTNGPGCMGNDFELMPSDPADLSTCSTSSGGKLTRFSVTGAKEPDQVLLVMYVFEGGEVSSSQVSSLLGNVPVEPTSEVPRLLQPLFPLTPGSALYKSRDGSLLIRVKDEGSTRKLAQTVTIVNLSSVNLFNEGIDQCLRAYGYAK